MSRYVGYGAAPCTLSNPKQTSFLHLPTPTNRDLRNTHQPGTSSQHRTPRDWKSPQRSGGPAVGIERSRSWSLSISSQDVPQIKIQSCSCDRLSSLSWKSFPRSLGCKEETHVSTLKVLCEHKMRSTKCAHFVYAELKCIDHGSSCHTGITFLQSISPIPWSP